MKKVFLLVLLATFAIAAYSQTDSTKVKKKKEKFEWISIQGIVADNFTKMGILDVKTTMMKEDSTVICTSEVYGGYGGDNGEPARTTHYYFGVSREPAKFILKFEHPNYETAYVNYELKRVNRRLEQVEGPKVYMKRIQNRKVAVQDGDIDGGMLDEVTVKATKIKMVWKGDTLVYYADAFNVPEGSMLDGLIKQLPGVELKDDGEIFVNGKKIDNLTLNGADFFKGKNKIMLQNLPYFTVKNIQVYKKQTALNKYLGIDDEDKKEYTMDVVLKREYSVGGSANVEAGGSPGPAKGGDWRYKLKGFGLRFSDHTRAVLFGGLNNINESMEFDRYQEKYQSNEQQAGDRHFKQIGGQFVYIGPEDKVNNSTEVNASWSDDRGENRYQSETFMNGGNSFSKSESTNRYKTNQFQLRNSLRLTGKFMYENTASLSYNHDSNQSEGWNLTTADAVMMDSINSSWSRSRGKYDRLNANMYSNLTKRLPTGDYFTFNVNANYNQSFNPVSTSLSHYVYHKLGTTDHRDRQTKSPSYSYNWNTNLAYNYNLNRDIRIKPEIAFGTGDEQGDRREYLRDSVDYIFDTQNSYNQRKKTMNRMVGVGFNLNKSFSSRHKGWSYISISAGFSANFQQQCLGYESVPLTTNLTRNYTILEPRLSMYWSKSDSIRSHNMNFYYSPFTSTPGASDLIDRPISSNPMYIFLGNPDLKSTTYHNFTLGYSIRRDSIDQTVRFDVNANITDNARVQGFVYDPLTGVRTYRPENINGGNWSAGTKVNWGRALDKKKCWFIGNEIGISYEKSTSLATTSTSISAELNRVGNTTVSYKPTLRFQKSKLSLSFKGDVTYRNIHRNITIGEQPTDIWEIGYGLNAIYKLPWNFTLDTDMTFHTRRGYTDDEMNDTRLYWDASLTKSFQQGKWLLKLRGYDLLSQVSSLHYWVSSDGRTEMWTNSMRRYALLTVSYRFSQKPKSK